jgi:BA14K-like protein
MKNRNAQNTAKGILVAATVWSLCNVGAAFAQVGMGAVTPPLGMTSPLGIGAGAPGGIPWVHGGETLVRIRVKGRGAQASVGSVVSSTDASYCAQRWAYYDPASGKYLGDDGQWHPCPG